MNFEQSIEKEQVERQTKKNVTHERLSILRNQGKFRISRSLILEENHEVLLDVFGNMIILKAEYLFPSDEIGYVALSPLFKPITEGCAPTDYDIIYKEARNDAGEITGYFIDVKELEQ